MIYSLLKYQWVFHRSSNGTLKFMKVNKYTKKYPPTINPSEFPTCVPREEWYKMQEGSICKVHPTSLWQDGMKDYKMDIWTQTYLSQSIQRPNYSVFVVSNIWYCDCVVSKLYCIQHKRHNSISNTLESESIYRTSIIIPLEIKRSYDHLISTMAFSILVGRHLYIESGPSSYVSFTSSHVNAPDLPCSHHRWRGQVEVGTHTWSSSWLWTPNFRAITG